jgi:hypothetical protein
MTWLYFVRVGYGSLVDGVPVDGKVLVAVVEKFLEGFGVDCFGFFGGSFCCCCCC